MSFRQYLALLPLHQNHSQLAQTPSHNTAYRITCQRSHIRLCSPGTCYTHLERRIHIYQNYQRTKFCYIEDARDVHHTIYHHISNIITRNIIIRNIISHDILCLMTNIQNWHKAYLEMFTKEIRTCTHIGCFALYLQAFKHHHWNLHRYRLVIFHFLIIWKQILWSRILSQK